MRGFLAVLKECTFTDAISQTLSVFGCNGTGETGVTWITDLILTVALSMVSSMKAKNL
jgi:hypothetical protein